MSLPQDAGRDEHVAHAGVQPRLSAQMVAAAHDDGARVAIHVRGGARAPTALAAGGDARVDGGARRVLTESAWRLHVYDAVGVRGVAARDFVLVGRRDDDAASRGRRVE